MGVKLNKSFTYLLKMHACIIFEHGGKHGCEALRAQNATVIFSVLSCKTGVS